jgi:hypothetical protein
VCFEVSLETKNTLQPQNSHYIFAFGVRWNKVLNTKFKYLVSKMQIVIWLTIYELQYFAQPVRTVLILVVCILLRVWEPGDGWFIPSTQRYYRRLLLLRNTVRTIISAPPLQNDVSHITAERMQLLLCRSPFCGGVTHGILQRWRAYDCTHCTTETATCFGRTTIFR